METKNILKQKKTRARDSHSHNMVTHNTRAHNEHSPNMLTHNTHTQRVQQQKQ